MMLFNKVLALVCLLFLSIADAQLTWTRVEAGGEVPPPRHGFSLAYDRFSHSIYLYGGGVDTKTYMFDIATGNWSVVHERNENSTGPLSYLFSYSGMIRLGGDGDTGESLFVLSHGFLSMVEYDDMWVFNIRLNTWTKVEPTGSVPSIRYGGHFGVFNNTNELWFGGGFTKETSLWTRYIDTYILQLSSPMAGAWTRIYDQSSAGNQFDPLTPHGRCLQASAVVSEDVMVIWGGCMRGGSGGGPCPADDSWYFDKSDRTWTELPRCATPRVWSAMTPLGPGKAVFYGGSTAWSGQVISAEEWPEDEVLVVDVNDKSWTRYKTQGDNGAYPTRRFAHQMVTDRDGVVYMFGGQTEDGATGGAKLNDLWTLTGDPSDGETMDCAGGWVSIPHVHGLFMAIAFGLLFPTGFFVARFFRCKKSKVWFICHVIIQVTAIIFTIPAFVIIFYAGASEEPTHPHAIIGIILMFLMTLQPINGILRPHIKEDKEKSCYRIIWEWFHRIYGISVILIGFVQVSLGVFLVVPPQGVWIVWILLMVTWIISFTVLEVVRCLRVLLCPGNDDDDTKAI